MKKILSILILALSLFIPLTAIAQDNKPDCKSARKEYWEKFRQDKHDYFAKVMELTDEQAQKFFPLFDEMEKKKFSASREVHREAHALMKNENATDEQYKAAADRANALSRTMAEIDAEYYAKFAQILSPRQLFLYHRCDVDFPKKALKKKHQDTRPEGKPCK